MSHIIVIGGGVVGLSIAYELSSRKHRVTLLEKNRVGRAASWAGAGILPATRSATAIHPLEKLESLSHEMHARWAADLRASTGVDTGYQACGGIHIARTPGDVAALAGQQIDWSEREIEFTVLSRDSFRERLPAMADSSPPRLAVFLPGECQLRNPHHLQALATACRQQGVEILENNDSIELIVEQQKTQSVRVNDQTLRADHYCVAAGAWSERLLAPFDLPLPSTPVRGQMTLFKLQQPLASTVVNEGIHYLVPRRDGHVLAGSTIEEVGFNTDTEPDAIADLVAWANGIVPACSTQTLVRSWAGLRPGTYDGFPYLGAMGSSPNTWVACGHLKSGLHMSPGTAVVMADLIEGQVPEIDLTPFSPSRAQFHDAPDPARYREQPT